jgi:hypothetical protein
VRIELTTEGVWGGSKRSDLSSGVELGRNELTSLSKLTSLSSGDRFHD